MAKVIILTTPDCAGCATVKSMLNRMNVKYKVVDVVKNPKILEKYPILTAPGIVINDKLEFNGVPREEDLRKKLIKSI